MNVERRFIPFEDCELRIEKVNDKPLIVGYAVKWGKRSKPIVGMFEEVFEKGAFRDVLDGKDVMALRDHIPHLLLGKVGAGTLRLREDDVGFGYEIDPPNTTYAADLMESISRRDVAGASFGFIADKEEWFEPKDKNQLTLRMVKHVGLLYDISPTGTPYYPDSEAHLRSMYEEHLAASKQGLNAAEIEAKRKQELEVASSHRRRELELAELRLRLTL